MELKFRVFTNGKMINCGVVPNLMSDGFAACIDNYDSISRVSGDVMQYTGLKDKNGVYIYEGDICVNENGRIANVIWFDRGACFDFIALNDLGDSYGYCAQMVKYKIAVIGNIYENHELLEQSK